MLEVKVVNNSRHPLPNYATEGSSGLDVYALLDEDLIIPSLGRVMVPTGLKFELPDDTEIQVRPRSGMAWKKGITVINSPGTIDSDYRGELKILLTNLSSESQTVSDGERIAQLVFARVEKLKWKEVNETVETERGSGGFGSTGTH